MKSNLKTYLKLAASVSHEHPVVISKFVVDAHEVEVDGVCDGTNVLLSPIMEHIENAGIHSGDATISLPPKTSTEQYHGESTRLQYQDRIGASHTRPIQHPIPGQGRYGLRNRMQRQSLAVHALRQQIHRNKHNQIGGAGPSRKQAGS